MKTNREIDTRIAEKVIGEAALPWGVDEEGNAYRRIPPYSTDIKAAWEVVEKLSPRIIVGPSPWKKGEYTATYNAYDGYADGFDWVAADTAPMAICLAALKVKGVI